MVSFGDNENIVKLIVVMVACVCKDTKKPLNCNTLNGLIVLYVNNISIKLLTDMTIYKSETSVV